MKGYSTEWEKTMPAIHQTRLIPRIYEELKKLSTKRTSNTINK
jgi:hypothetical protein